jgi:two-component system, cell cycle sensor histidine kinase and response regulator CckA
MGPFPPPPEIRLPMHSNSRRRRAPQSHRATVSGAKPVRATSSADVTFAEAGRSPDAAFWITDFAFSRMVYLSRGFEKLWGRSCASVYERPRSIFDAVHPADYDRVTKHYARQKEGVPLDVEYRILHPDGSVRWIWDRRSPMGDSSDQVYTGVAQDITDRKLAEQIVRRHSSVVQSSSEAIISTTLEGVITAWNPAAEALFGYSVKEATGASVMLITPAELAEEETLLLQRVARGEDVGAIETQRRRRNGELLDIAMTVSPLRESDNHIIGAAIICRDITREKAAQLALQESERCFRASFDTAPVGMAHVALDGQLVRVNQELRRLTGFSNDALLQQTLQGLADPDDRAIDAVQKGDLLTGKIDRYSVAKRLVRRNDFPIWTQMTVMAVRRTAGVPDYLFVVVQEISRERSLEAQLRQAQKMETIGQLASGVAHDFNNVLGYVTMRAELTCTYPNLPANVLADLQQIKAAANRATHLTRQLLSFSRNEPATRPQRIEINELVGSTVKMVQRLLGENLTLEVKLEAQPIIVHLDPGIIDQVLLNLAVNARDAMPEGGSLTIETSEFRVPDLESRPSPELAPGAYVCLRVTDTGTGIAPENMPRIFEPFFTTKAPGRGTGLGLAMVSTLVKQQHGWITVESEMGHGTTFRVYLPALDAGTVVAAIEPVVPRAAHRSETILLVEDEADLRMTARMVLQLQGYKVLEAASGFEAVQIWAEHKREIALIFTDMVLPDGLSGRALAARAQVDRPDIKVVFTTGYSPDVAGREVTLHDGQNFLPKPYSIDRLLSVINDRLTVSPRAA